MKTDDLRKLEQEAERLRKELSEMSLTQKRLRAIEQLLEVYTVDEGQQNTASRDEETDEAQGEVPVFEGVRPRTARILAAVWKEIRNRGEPVATRKLVEALRTNGIEIGGKDAVATLSAALSHSEHFENRGRNVGWAIRDEPAANIDH